MDVFPTLVGLQWNRKKAPEFSNLKQRAVSGREIRVAQMSYPLYNFALSYEVLRDTPNVATPAAPFDELKKLEGFFLKQQASLKAFLFTDPTDSAVTDMQFATADGITAGYQLTRTYGVGATFAEPVQNLNGAVANIKDNGGTISPANYTVSATGFATFNPVILAGHVLTWTGSYYYRVRFERDLSEFNQFMQDLWENKKVEFVGALGNKV